MTKPHLGIALTLLGALVDHPDLATASQGR